MPITQGIAGHVATTGIACKSFIHMWIKILE